MVEAVLAELHARYHGIDVDRYVIMPNHLHAIIVLLAGPAGLGLTPENQELPVDRSAPRLALGDIVQRFKAMTSARYRAGVARDHWKRYEGILWQRDYYEHIVRDRTGLARIREYIESNPLRWDLDRENPARTGRDPFDEWLESFQDSADAQPTNE